MVAAEEGEVAGLDRWMASTSSAMDGSITTCSVRALVNDTIWISLVSGCDMTPLTSYCGSSARTVVVRSELRSTRRSRLALASTDDSR